MKISQDIYFVVLLDSEEIYNVHLGEAGARMECQQLSLEGIEAIPVCERVNLKINKEINEIYRL